MAKTLHELRLNSLHRLPPGWRIDPGGKPVSAKLLPALRAGYNHVTAYAVKKNPSFRTFLWIAVLSPDGSLTNVSGWMPSAKDRRYPVQPEGTKECAERKFLDTGFDELRTIAGVARSSDVWFFYLTRSPCGYCAKAIYDAWTQERFRHAVVAFEGCYQEWEPPKGRPGDAFFEAVVNDSDLSKPGIELIKTFRTAENSIKLDESLRYAQLGFFPPATAGVFERVRESPDVRRVAVYPAGRHGDPLAALVQGKARRYLDIVDKEAEMDVLLEFVRVTKD